MEEKDSSAAVIRELASIKEFTIEGVPAIAVPPNYKIEQFPQLLSAPKSIERSVQAHDVAGFVAYVNRFKTEATALFASLTQPLTLKGFLDYHAPGAPSHVRHILTCGMEHSEEWKRWTASNKKAMAQKEFGTFLEDNLKDVVEPRGSDLLALALNFSNMRTVEFKSSQRLSDGQTQLQYVEKDGGVGEAKLPEKIGLALPVFRGDTHAYKVSARLKLLVKEANLAIWYELERSDLVIEQAYADVLELVEKETGIKPFHGAA